jgi:hypothetical protein
MSWPESVVTAAKEFPALFLAFVARFVSGVDVFTHFSGMAGPEIGMQLLADELQKSGPEGTLDGCLSKASGFAFMEACDSKPLCQRVLKGYAEHGPRHVYTNVLEYFPQDVQTTLKACCPEIGMTVDDMAYAHGAVAEVLQNVESATDSTMMHAAPHCCVHDGPCPMVAVSESRLSLCWAGPPCLDDSTLGQRAGQHGPQSLFLLAWIFQIRARSFDIVIREGTPACSDSVLTTHLGDEYEVPWSQDKGGPV